MADPVTMYMRQLKSVPLLSKASEVDAAKNHAAKEQQRLADLESARAQLAAYEVALAPKLAARRERRAKKIAQLKKELVDRRREALAQQTAWETEQQGGSVWTTLDPQFLRSLEGDLIITRNPDRSFTATGESVGAGYALEASTPLSDITGVRVDVLADPELPQNGPGKDSDGDFVLTELEVATRNVPQRDSVVFRQWDFANNVGGWKWNGDFDQELDDGRLRLKIGEDESGDWWVNVSAPAGGFVLEIVAKASRQIGLAARWITADAPGVIEDDDKLFKTGIVPSDDGWSRYRIFFRSETDLVKLGLTPRAVGGAELLVDSISLLRYEADEFAPVALQNPQADFSAEGHDVALAADGENKLDIGWSIGPETGLDHVAVFETTQDVAGGDDGWLRLVLSQQTDDFNRIIGRFRLSVTSSARPISLGLPQEIAEIVARPAGQRSADDTERLERYYLGQQKGLVRLKYLLAETEKPLPPDEGLVAHQAGIARLEKPTPLDAKLLRLRNHAQLSADQLGRRRLTAAQDIAWALINSPAFLYNH